MDSLERFWEQLCSCFPYVLLAMGGSAVRWLNKGLAGGAWGLFVSNITAGFIALLCGLSAEFLHLESGGVFFLSGMAGFMGGSWVMERFVPLCGPEGYEWRNVRRPTAPDAYPESPFRNGNERGNFGDNEDMEEGAACEKGKGLAFSRREDEADASHDRDADDLSKKEEA